MITTRPQQWDHIVDVVVVGSGGGALVAATMASDGGVEVLLVEKDQVIGGTTGVSGGVLWIPGNHHAPEVGLEDTREDALAYIRRLADGREPDPALVDVFLDAGPEMLAYLEANTPLEMRAVSGFPDYYFGFDIPGKTFGGRSVEPVPYAVRTELPDWADRIALRTTLLSLGARTTLSEEMARMMSGEEPSEVVQRETDDVRVKGAALVGCLLKGLLDRGVEIRTATPARELVVVDGAVIGVRCEHDGQDVLVGTRKGVVLACGGFEWNAEMVRAFIGYDVLPVSPPNNTGDGHIMVMEAGGKLANMMSYWGTGAMFDPTLTHDGKAAPQFDAGRQSPGAVIVNRHARRFVNEAVTYNDFPKAFGSFDANLPGFPNTPPAWLIFDAKARDAGSILSIQPGQPAPEWVTQADTVASLAGRIGLDPDALRGTIAQFNAEAAGGADTEFARAGTAPVDTPPFHAIEIHPGSLGTNGGARIDGHARVLSHRGGVVEGLYAAGNTAAGVFGWAYPSGGAPIALSCTFGYLAGRHVAARASRPFES